MQLGGCRREKKILVVLIFEKKNFFVPEHMSVYKKCVFGFFTLTWVGLLVNIVKY